MMKMAYIVRGKAVFDVACLVLIYEMILWRFNQEASALA